MWTIIVIGICIVLNAALAGMEIAFVSVNKSLVRNYANKGDLRAKLLLDLKEKPEKTLSTIQIGITLLAALSAAVGGSAAGLQLIPFLQNEYQFSLMLAEIIAMIFVVVPITYVSVVIGEITPKALVIRDPYFYAIRSAPLLKILSQILYPAVKLCEISTMKLLSLFHKKKTKEEDDYEKIIAGYRNLPEKGKEYVINLIKIQEVKIKDILLEWNAVEFVTTNQVLDQVIKKIISSGHTRMPVVEGNKVVGMINTKEILAFERSKEDSDWKKLIRSPIKLTNSDSPLHSLNTMQKQRMHMAIVEENEMPIGVITLEDIIEEILGEIYDEDDDGSLRKILEK